MATNSNVRLGAQKEHWSSTPHRGLRAQGLFARWPWIGILMFTVGCLIFGALAYAVETDGKLLQWDAVAAQALRPDRLDLPSSLMEYVLFGFFLGRDIILIAMTTFGIYFLYRRYWREFMMILAGPGIGGLLWFMLSRYFDRPRPVEQMELLKITVPSFPSGHAMTAMVGYGLLAYLIIPNMPNRFWKWSVGIGFALLTLFVGLSRIILGGHYLSDVIAGYAAGIAWAGLTFTLAERFIPRPNVHVGRKGADDFQGLRSPGLFKRKPLVAFILFFLGSLGMAVLGYNVLTQGPLAQMDQAVHDQWMTVAREARPMLNELMIFGFFIGKQVILLTVALFSIYFIYRRYWMELAMLLTASAGGSFVWEFFISYFARPRPAEQLGLVITSLPSFPSGHAMSLVICVGFLAYILIPRMPTRFWKWTLGVVLLLLVLFGGFSRIFHGNHYLTDVLAGYSLGLAWSVLVYTVIENIFWRRKV